MAKKRLSQKQVDKKARKVEELINQGQSISAACKQVGLAEATFYAWRKRQAGTQAKPAAKKAVKKAAKAAKKVARAATRPAPGAETLRQLQEENRRLRELLVEAELEKSRLREQLGK